MANFEDLIVRDTAANRPTAGVTGRLFYDTTNSKLQRDNGAGWDDVEAITASGGIPVDGWVEADSMTYASADDPTFALTITGDKSTTYGVGMRIKLTQSTGGTKYFVITKVDVSTNTTLTLYGGTDYNLEDEAITSPYYSPVKAPLGFPLSPAKWTVVVTDTSNRSQIPPTQNVWYNLGSITISIPIGSWRVHYSVMGGISDSTAGAWPCYVTLSTANNSESDADFTSGTSVEPTTHIYNVQKREKVLDLSAKTSYYLNSRTTVANLDNLYNRGDLSKTIIQAVCAYL
jgi:hypothetical protein